MNWLVWRKSHLLRWLHQGIKGSPVGFECRTFQILDMGPRRRIVLGQVLATHIEDKYLLDADRCHIDTCAFQLVARMHGRNKYSRTMDQLEMERP